MTHVPVYLSPKRKRGRPRKDASIYKAQSFKSLTKPHLRKNINAYKDDGMVGRTVCGVIEGSFDAGFLISVRTSNNCTPFRGVVFHTDKVVPVTPANDLAPDAMMYQRRYIPASAYTLPSQFNCISTIPSCRPQTTIAPCVFTGHSTFSVSEPTLPIIGNPRLVNNKPSTACPIENLDESLFGYNMNDVVTIGDTVSEASFESMFDSFLGNGLKSNVLMQNKLHNSALETHHNFASQSEFGAQQNGNQCVWQREPHVINSELELTDVYHSETNSLDINFHQNLFTYPSQNGSQEQPTLQASDFHAFGERVSSSPSLMLNFASVKQEKKPLQEPECSNARVESRYSVPFSQSTENETNTVLKSLLETSEIFHDEDGSSLAEVGSPGPVLTDESLFTLELAAVQSTTERRVHKTSSSFDSITDMDYVPSDVVQFAEPHGHFWETNFT